MLIAVVAIFGICYLPVHLLNILRWVLNNNNNNCNSALAISIYVLTPFLLMFLIFISLSKPRLCCAVLTQTLHYNTTHIFTIIYLLPTPFYLRWFFMPNAILSSFFYQFLSKHNSFCASSSVVLCVGFLSLYISTYIYLHLCDGFYKSFVALKRRAYCAWIKLRGANCAYATSQ